jgi:hypothetical protein
LAMSWTTLPPLSTNLSHLNQSNEIEKDESEVLLKRTL